MLPATLVCATDGFAANCGHRSASSNRFPKNVRVHAVVVAELKFGDVQGKIFGRNLVEGADNAPLQDRPEAFDGLSVNRPTDILPSGVVNSLMREMPIQMLIADPFVRAEQADFGRDTFANESLKSLGANVRDDTRHDVALAADSTSNNVFARSAGSTTTTTLVPMAVLGFAPDARHLVFHTAHE